MMRWRQDRTVFWVVTVFAVLALIFGLAQYRQARQLSLRAEAARQRAIFNLISHVENMEGGLAKARVSSTLAQQSSFLTACWSHSQAAQENISLIGMTTLDMSGMQKFIAQVGDYCMVLSQKLARGDAVVQSEWQELARLETSVQDLARALAETGASAVATGSSRTGVSSLVLGIDGLFLSAAPSDETWLRGFSEIDSLIQSVPSPAYDGPFSDRSLASKPLATTGSQISGDKAKAVALGFLHSGEQYDSVRVENIEGVIPAFLVTGKRADGSEVATAIVKAGGAVLWAMDQRPRDAGNLGVEAARNSAKQFLASKGMESLVETGWRKAGTPSDRIVFAFAATTSFMADSMPLSVVLYPDLIKVEVALDKGDIVGFDQTAYLTNHGPREFKQPIASIKEARKTLKPDLKVTGGPRLAVIPMVSAREIMAWEFQVVHQNDTYLIYVNAMTGKEEMVLKMVIDDTGSLTM